MLLSYLVQVNFLGHVFLNPDDDLLLVGNFIADSVKGDPYKKLPKPIADGVMLHRMIDSFTDSHEQVKLGVNRFRPTQGRYAPVVVDIVYDHILASNWQSYHQADLSRFVQDVYERLEQHQEHFPPKVKAYFPFLKTQNWLYNYQYEWGLLKSLQGLDKRASVPTEMYRSVDVYKEHQNAFKHEFSVFVSEAKEQVLRYLGAE
ncbi:ACP phosphodiesterase [Bacteroidota bacterium]